MSPLEPVLSIDAAPQRDAYVIRPEGELDLAGCPDLESALDVVRIAPERQQARRAAGRVA